MDDSLAILTEQLDEDLAQQAMILDPSYQENLYQIQTALQEAGALPKPQGQKLPDVHDEALRKLIDAVTME